MEYFLNKIEKHQKNGFLKTVSTKVKKFSYLLTISIVMLFSMASFAANPVTVVVSLTPPYSPFLNEYGSAGVNKLQVSVITNDSRMINHPAKLQMLIEHVGSGVVMRTSEYAAIAPILLNGNVTDVYNGFDLSPYFLAQNNVFSGLDQSQYMQTGRLPDGQYRIGFRVVDGQRTDVILSNTAFTQPGWFILNDPPQINLPRNNEQVRINEFQNLKLEWFPRHLGSLNASFPTSYQVELFAIRIPGMDPNQVAMSSLPVFTDVSNTTSYYLTSDRYMLEPGVAYALRIKAMAGDGNLTLFQNNGYSQVFAFSYGSVCPQPENITVQTPNNTKAGISWDTDPTHTAFKLRFRKAGQQDGEWHTRESFTGTAEIANILSPGIKYEYQLKATCNTVESNYTDLDYFTMPYPAAGKFMCGAEDLVNVTNTNPKPSLFEGEMIFYGKFPIKLTEVKGEDGTFSGTGRMRIPFLANVQVNMQFDDIKVNELNEVYAGELVSIYNPDSKFLIDDVTDYFAEGDQIGNIIDGVDSAAITLGFVVANESQLTVNISGDYVTVTGPNGEKFSGTVENGAKGTTIKDAEGNLYAVDEKGEAKKVGKAIPEGESGGGEAGGAASFATNDLDDEIEIRFENAGQWAMDTYSPVYEGSAFAKEYEEVDGVKIPWKFVPIGQSDKITATITKGSIDPAKIKFITPTGTEFFGISVGGKLEITLIGARQRDGYELFAVYQEDENTTRTIGKINVASYPLISRKVIIVPMHKKFVSVTDIKNGLNEIYNPYGVNWEVTLDTPFEDKSWDTGNDGLKSTGTEFYSALTDEMRALRASYTGIRSIDPESVYLFLFDKQAEDNSGMQGDMPLDYQFGFIFSPSIDAKTYHTMAHELGHGMFQLRHPFSPKYGMTKGATDNLMDYPVDPDNYNNYKKLAKYQWDVLHDPKIMVAKWAQDEAEGAYTDQTYIQKVLQQLRCASFNGVATLKLSEKTGTFNGSFETVSSVWLTITNKDIVLNRVTNPEEKQIGGQKGSTAWIGKYGDGLTIQVVSKNKSDFHSIQDYIFPSENESSLGDAKKFLAGIKDKKELSSSDIEKLRSIANCGSEYLSVAYRYKLIKQIESLNPYFLAPIYEDLILDLIENYREDVELTEYADEWLELLASDRSLLNKLFYGIDDYQWWSSGSEENRTRFMHIIQALWQISKFNDTQNQAYKYDQYSLTSSGDIKVESPYTLVYGGSKLFPRVEYDPVVTSDDVRFKFEVYTPEGIKYGHFNYHPFQPINLIKENQNGVSYLLYDMPAIALVPFMEADNFQRGIERVGLTADIILTITGVGNLSKLRHLTKIQKVGRILLAGIEVASSSLDIVLDYTAICSDEEFCSKLKQYNFYLQMALLGGEGMSSLYKGMMESSRKSAKEAYLESRNLLITKHGEESREIRALDEHFDLTLKNYINLSDDLLSKLKSKGWSNDLIEKLDIDLADPIFKSKFSEELVDVWGKLINQPEWVRKNTKLLEKLSGESDEFIKKVDDFYATTMKNNTPANFDGAGRYTHNVYFDEFGFPDFNDFNPIGNQHVFPNATGKRADDFKAAKKWMQDKPEIEDYLDLSKDQTGGSPFKVKINGKWSEKMTWHHHENGKDLIPVLSDIHNTTKHIGGVKIVELGLTKITN